MDTAERIYEEAKHLPEAQAREVLHYLEFLKSKVLTKKTPVSHSATNDNETPLPGFGMWTGRDDLPDANAAVRQIREPRYKL